MTPPPAGVDDLGLPVRPSPVAVPVGAPVEVGLRLVVADAAEAPGVRCYLLSCGHGTSALAPVAGLAAGALVLEVRAAHRTLLRWLHDDVLLGHLLTEGSAQVDGDLMALSLVDGWAWYRRRAPDPVPAAIRTVPEASPPAP